LWERTFVKIVWLTRKIGVRIVANMAASASDTPVVRRVAAFVIAAVGGLVVMSNPGLSVITRVFILIAFALVAGLFARPPFAATAGICVGMAPGAYLNRDKFSDDPGFPRCWCRSAWSR